MEAKDLAKNAIIAGVYVVLTLINPVGWGAIQFRFSEMLSVIPFYKEKYIPGILLGLAIANSFSPLGMIDVAVGLICGIVTYSITRYLENNYIKGGVFAIVCGIFVGLELKYVLNLPFIMSFVSITISTMLTSVLGIWLIEKTVLKKFLELDI